MKIAFLLQVFPKTSETFIVNQILGLIDRGHMVDIFARYRNSDEPVHPQVDEYQLTSRTQYLTIPTRRKERVLKAGLEKALASIAIGECFPIRQGGN